MPITKRKIKSLRDIRTNADRKDQFVEPYKGYLRLGSLEMERARQLKERKKLEERIKKIEARCRQIDGEKAWLLKVIARDADELGYNEKVVPVRRKVVKKDMVLPPKIHAGATPQAQQTTVKKGPKTPDQATETQSETETRAEIRQQEKAKGILSQSSGFTLRY